MRHARRNCPLRLRAKKPRKKKKTNKTAKKKKRNQEKRNQEGPRRGKET